VRSGQTRTTNCKIGKKKEHTKISLSFTIFEAYFYSVLLEEEALLAGLFGALEPGELDGVERGDVNSDGLGCK